MDRFWGVVAFGLVLCSGTLVFLGLQPSPPEPAPTPPVTFQLDPQSQNDVPKGENAPFVQGSALRGNRLYIPSLGVDASVEPTGAAAGSLVIPPADRVGMFTGAASIGADQGTTMLAGHVSSHGVRGALHDLAYIRPNSLVIVTDSNGHPTYWAVKSLDSIPKADLAMGGDVQTRLFPSSGPHRLALITCGGAVVPSGSTYTFSDNVIAIAVPATAQEG